MRLNHSKASGDTLNVNQLRELLAKERQFTEQQLNEIKTALANLEKQLTLQEVDASQYKK